MIFTDDICEYGFITPNGEYISVPWGEHTEWAYQYIDLNNIYEDFYYSNYDYPVDYLVYDKGFILIDSPGYGIPNITIPKEKSVTEAQRETLYDYYMWVGQTESAMELYRKD